MAAGGRGGWACADPGVQFDTTINDWHTSLASGRINASNPCSEYLFLDDTACNLASLNLMTFYDTKTNTFRLDDYRHAIRLWTIVLEISVLMAQFPSAEIARLSYIFRTLGLGYANLGTLLMIQGVPYDSPEGRAIAGALTAMLHCGAYAASAEWPASSARFRALPAIASTCCGSSATTAARPGMRRPATTSCSQSFRWRSTRSSARTTC